MHGGISDDRIGGILMKTIHGGDIYRNHVTLDFSVNMNPLGIPESVKEALHAAVDRCHTYPDIHAEQLKTAVGEMIGIFGEKLIFGNGASELFIAIVHALQPKHVVIPVPSFYGYEHAAAAVAAHVEYVPMKEENHFLPGDELFSSLTDGVDMLFLANPNNPTGVRMEKEDLKRIAMHCREKHITVVLDECFIEFCEDHDSMLDQLEELDNLIIVRAFTKIFTIPGVRLGYLVCRNEEIREKISRQLPEWNLSTFAQMAGVACAKETQFVSGTAKYLKMEREALLDGLKQVPGMDCTVYPGAANFLLLKSSKPLYQKFLAHGILIRDCSNFRGLGAGYYRVAVKTKEDNEQLLKVAGEINWNE